MLTAALLASAHYWAALHEDAALPPLDDVLRAACRKPYRRLDRFAQLALLGSAHCALGQQLRSDCGIYMGSTHGPQASNIRVQQQMLRAHELPKPFDFVNTLGSITGFYVADNLQLNGPSLFVSRHGRSLEVALETALIDLAVGAVEQALVGVVEESPLPLAEQRRRLQLSDDACLGEGSHWMLLAAATQDAPRRRIGLQRFADGSALASMLGAQASPTAATGLGRGLEPEVAHRVRRNCPHAVDIASAPLPFHDSLEAAWFVDQVANAAGADVMLLNGADGGDICLLQVGTQALID